MAHQALDRELFLPSCNEGEIENRIDADVLGSRFEGEEGSRSRMSSIADV